MADETAEREETCIRCRRRSGTTSCEAMGLPIDYQIQRMTEANEKYQVRSTPIESNRTSESFINQEPDTR